MPRPSWIAANVVAGLQNLVAILEAIVAENKIDSALATSFSCAVATAPAPSLAVPAPTAQVAGLGNALVAVYNAVPLCVQSETGIDASLPAALFALSNGIGQAMTPEDAAAAFAAAADAIADVAALATGTPNRIADSENAGLVACFSRYCLLAPYAQGLVTQTYATRQQAITARADCVERFERELQLCNGAGWIAVASALIAMRDNCVNYLTQAEINAAPVVTVSAPVMLPSLWWAWRLYNDPTRARELIERNDVAHASYMPETFEALAPSA